MTNLAQESDDGHHRNRREDAVTSAPGRWIHSGLIRSIACRIGQGDKSLNKSRKR